MIPSIVQIDEQMLNRYKELVPSDIFSWTFESYPGKLHGVYKSYGDAERARDRLFAHSLYE